MPRSSVPIEVNHFVAGFISDANPLTFPDNASIEEENMILNIDGSRQRRLGLDFEDGYQEITTTIANADTVDVAVSSFKWDNAGGDPETSILVVQTGSELRFHPMDPSPISGNAVLLTYDVTAASDEQAFSFTVVDGILVVATGQKDVQIFTYASGVITRTSTTLKIRDLFGVEDVVSAVDLFEHIDNRPTTIPKPHLYNLRNQTWAVPRIDENTENIVDCITEFYLETLNTVYPSNSDTVNAALMPDASDTDNRTVDRFFPENIYKNPRGTTPAPKGYFIIDALERGDSREAAEAELRANYSALTLAVTAGSLPNDITPGGAKCATEFAGRVFFSGFSGEVQSGDKNSPRMSSYVLFSRLVNHTTDVHKCYQEGDPTSKEQPDLVATDGGFFRVYGAYNIQAMFNVGSSLLILAQNGVWRVYGGSDYGFDATNYVIERVTDHGVVSPDSIVPVDNTIMFWGDDGIYHVRTNEFGDWTAQNITFSRIQDYYSRIPAEDKRRSKAAYDSFERKVRWIYYNRLTDDTPTNELVLDINLQAFYLNRIMQYDNSNVPRMVSPMKVNPYQIINDTTPVVVNTEQVQVNGEDVVMGIEDTLTNPIQEIAYLVVTQIVPVIKYTFAFYRNVEFRDWYSFDSVGLDAEAFVVTGYSAGPEGQQRDHMRYKGVPYLFVHCRRTETGFEELIDGDFEPINQSSCIVQARWDWADSSNSNRWGNPFQAYRYKRLYFPVDVLDTYDTGFTTIVTKNKLRGKGRVLSLKFSTEPYRDLHLYGWSYVMSMPGNV